MGTCRFVTMPPKELTVLALWFQYLYYGLTVNVLLRSSAMHSLSGMPVRFTGSAVTSSWGGSCIHILMFTYRKNKSNFSAFKEIRNVEREYMNIAPALNVAPRPLRLRYNTLYLFSFCTVVLIYRIFTVKYCTR